MSVTLNRSSPNSEARPRKIFVYTNKILNHEILFIYENILYIIIMHFCPKNGSGKRIKTVSVTNGQSGPVTPTDIL